MLASALLGTMGFESRARLLRTSTILSTASDETIEVLARSSRLRTIERYQLICLEGEPCRSVYLCVSGMLRVFVTAFDGSEPTLAVAGPGDHFGELGAIDDLPRSASVAALRRSEILEAPALLFEERLRVDPGLAHQVLTLLAMRIRNTSGNLADLTYLDLGGRLAKFLLAESAKHGADTFELPFNQSELGQILGGARQTVNQLLQGFVRAELIAVQGRKVTILDEVGLELRATPID